MASNETVSKRAFSLQLQLFSRKNAKCEAKKIFFQKVQPQFSAKEAKTHQGQNFRKFHQVRYGIRYL
jgi:uncharacterized FlgJ-related protein